MRIGVFIITTRSRTSLKVLEKELGKTHFVVTLIDAFTPESIPSEARSQTRISNIESAIALSHHKARIVAAGQAFDWNVFLEDDAILSGDFKNLESFFELFEKFNSYSNAIGIHLYPEQFGILRVTRDQNYYKILSMPDCAVGYALNKKALSSTIALNRVSEQVADWPDGISKFSWFAPLTSYVCHPDLKNQKNFSASTIARTNRRQNEIWTSKIKSKFAFKTLIFFFFRGKLRNYRFGINAIESENLRTLIIPF